MERTHQKALPDATGSRVGVGWIVNFGDELIGVGADEARLAVWRSGDCGASWSREADRPELAVEPRGRRISATVAFATDEAVVVIAAQAERGLSFRRLAWLLRRDGSWERSPDPVGLPRALIDGPPDTGHWGVSYRAGVPFMVQSWDLVTWTDVGPLPGDGEPAWDEASGRLTVYFCDPRSPWQRPTNENTNGLLRDWFPKGSDLSVHTADDIARVQAELNDHPRRVLGWKTPADRMATLLGPPSVLRR